MAKQRLIPIIAAALLLTACVESKPSSTYRCTFYSGAVKTYTASYMRVNLDTAYFVYNGQVTASVAGVEECVLVSAKTVAVDGPMHGAPL